MPLCWEDSFRHGGLRVVILPLCPARCPAKGAMGMGVSAPRSCPMLCAGQSDRHPGTGRQHSTSRIWQYRGEKQHIFRGRALLPLQSSWFEVKHCIWHFRAQLLQQYLPPWPHKAIRDSP